MSFRSFSLTALALAAISPSISFAGAEDHALKACVSAFAASLKAPATPAVKLNYARGASSPISDFYAQEFTSTMHANDPKSKAPIAAASCSATQKGEVLSMSTIQTPVDGVKFASR